MPVCRTSTRSCDGNDGRQLALTEADGFRLTKAEPARQEVALHPHVPCSTLPRRASSSLSASLSAMCAASPRRLCRHVQFERARRIYAMSASLSLLLRLERASCCCAGV